MSTVDPSKVITYLKGCYESDNREQVIYNFRDRKVEHQLFLESSEVLTGEIPHEPITTSYGQALEAELKEYEFEKHIFICAFFLSGKMAFGKKNKTICAPLLLIPAELTIKEGLYSVEPDFSAVGLNTAFFRCLNAVDDDDISSMVEVMDVLQGKHLDFHRVAQIHRILEERYPEIDAKELLMFPNLAAESPTKNIKNFKVIPNAAIGVLRRSSNTVNVLKELNELGNSKNLSGPLKHLIQGDSNIGPWKVVGANTFPVVPSALNQRQITAIENSKNYTTSVIIGPPGTGKSYTIAALAIDAIYHGRSVLVASANNQAVDVVQNKIEQAFSLENICIRLGGKGDYKNQLKNRIENLLNNIGVEFIPREKVDTKNDLVLGIMDHLTKLEKEYLEKANITTKKGKRLTGSGYRLITGFWHSIEKMTVGKEKPIWKILIELEKLYPEKYEALTQLIQLKYKESLYNSVRKYRSDLRAFSKAIRSRTIKTRIERFEKIDFHALKGTFPVWLTNLSEVGMVLPMKKELFDLVIIDEASQCDMARALPLLQRGRNAIICGDVKQLRHVSFLSPKKTQIIADKLGMNPDEAQTFDYKGKSILDMTLDAIEEQDAISFLNEHFRSRPEIIEFSNRQFYGSDLRIMTESPFKPKNQALRIRQTNGSRIEGINAKEGEVILESILEVLVEERDWPTEETTSIGVLSPFREQVNYLYDFLYEHLPGDAYTRHNILIGTAHSFQGEERDMMFLSFAVDDDSHPTALRHLNKDDVFNVSITRARSIQHVIVSRKAHLFPPKSLMAKYLQFAEQNEIENTTSGDRVHDDFSQEVFDFLNQQGLEKIWIDYTLSGIRFDLVVKNKGKIFGIDLIGYPGAFDEVIELDRIKIFKRAGNRVFPIPYNLWLYDRDNLILDLSQFLGIKSPPSFG